MRRRLAPALAAAVVLALALPGCDLFAGEDPPGGDGGLPPAGPRSPVEGQPPIVWIGGTLTEIADTRLTVRDASSNPVRMQRLAGGTTRFLVTQDGSWRELGADEVTGVGVGREVCAEALLDGTNLVALRVFLDAACGPTGAVP